MPALSVVLPCYNERGNLVEILNRYRALRTALDMELILVDNGSNDGSSEALKELLAVPENTFARSVRVDRNQGYGFGLKSGLREAQGELIGFSHADLQCRPEDFIEADKLMRERGPARLLLKGRRRGFRPFPDRCVTFAYNGLSRVLLGLRAQAKTSDGDWIARTPDVNAEPKVFPRSLLANVLQGPDDFTFDLFVLEAARRSGFEIVEFDVSYEARRWGKSKLAANPWVRAKTSARAFRKLFGLRLSR
jgi:glycosyltransferase involved in cell wall biosynthesis